MDKRSDSTCIICNHARTEGITICLEFICTECEQEMVKTDVQDEKYPFFITQLKQIGYRKDA